jgi:hypothetical protein
MLNRVMKISCMEIAKVWKCFEINIEENINLEIGKRVDCLESSILPCILFAL